MDSYEDCSVLFLPSYFFSGKEGSGKQCRTDSHGKDEGVHTPQCLKEERRDFSELMIQVEFYYYHFDAP